MTKAGHNSGDMSEADRKVLFFINRQAYLKAMEAKKIADAAVKNVGKQIKSDLGPNGLTQIKEYERARTPEGEAAIKAEMEAKRQSWRWAGMPIDTQADMFADLAPLDERAFEDGETAGMEGETYANPYDANSHHGKQYEAGWKSGQAKLFEGIKKKEAEAAEHASELIKGDSPFADDEEGE